MTNRIIYCEGLTQPGPGGWGCWAFCAVEGKEIIHEEYGCIGHGPDITNSKSDYAAVLQALRWAYQHQWTGCEVRTDSQLVVEQVNRNWTVRAASLVDLHARATKGAALVQARLVWVPREENERADALSKQAYYAAAGLQPEADPIASVVHRLDTMQGAVTAWETEFLNSILRQLQQGRRVSPKQRLVIQRMASQYLSEEAAADVAGQTRLALKEKYHA